MAILPLSDDPPLHYIGYPYVSYGLMAARIVVFLYQLGILDRAESPAFAASTKGGSLAVKVATKTESSRKSPMIANAFLVVMRQHSRDPHVSLSNALDLL